MVWGRAWLGTLLLFHAGNAIAEDWKLYADMDLLTYSELVPVEAVINDWRGENRGGETALSLIRLESGLSGEDWRVGVLYRNDYHLSFTPETAAFFHNKKLGLPFVPTQVYHLDLNGFHFEATGVTASYSIPLWERLQLTLQGELLEGRKLRELDAHASGTFAELNNWRDIFDLRFAQNYTEYDPLLGKLGVPDQTSPPDGRGYSFGASMEWMDEPWKFQLAVDDGIGKIEWNRAHKTTLHMVTGKHNTWFPQFPDYAREVNVVQRLPVQFRGGANYQLAPEWLITGRWRRTRDHDFVYGGVEWSPTSTLKLGVELEPLIGAAAVALKNSWMKIRVASDDVQWKDAHYLALQASVSYTW